MSALVSTLIPHKSANTTDQPSPLPQRVVKLVNIPGPWRYLYSFSPVASLAFPVPSCTLQGINYAPGGILRQKNMLSQENFNNEVFTIHTFTEPLLCFRTPHGTHNRYVEKHLVYMREIKVPAHGDRGKSGLLCDLPKCLESRRPPARWKQVEFLKMPYKIDSFC